MAPMSSWWCHSSCVMLCWHSRPSWPLFSMKSWMNLWPFIYIADLLMYSKIVEEHAKHFEYGLSKLWKNQLFSNKAKSEFSQEEMDFLGHILSWEGVRPDLKKLKSIQDYKKLIIIKGNWSFIGLASFYRKFIKNFSPLTKLYSDLLKKMLSFEWNCI